LNNPESDTAGLGLPAELNTQSPLDIDILSTTWENVGEESFINVCELQLKFDGSQLSTSTTIYQLCYLPPASNSALAINPLPPLVDCGGQLNNLEFICVSPTPRQLLSPSKTFNKDDRPFYLASTYINFGECKL
jgi:hypothetical protein